jgi:hypothetical protein
MEIPAIVYKRLGILCECKYIFLIMHNNVVMQRRARKERASDLARSFIASMPTVEEFHGAE